MIGSMADESLTVTTRDLGKLQGDIQKTLEKISSREKYLNTQLEEPLTGYKQLSHLLAQTREQYRNLSSGLVDRSRLLASLTDHLDR